LKAQYLLEVRNIHSSPECRSSANNNYFYGINNSQTIIEKRASSVRERVCTNSNNNFNASENMIDCEKVVDDVLLLQPDRGQTRRKKKIRAASFF